MRTRKTKQQALLEKTLEQFTGFFTAEEFYAIVCKKQDNIGIATIYRFLKECVEEQKIHNYICNRKNVYAMSTKSHCHFKCEKCGKISHIQIKNIDFLKNNIPGKICHFQIDVFGLCESCQKNNE